MKFGSVCSGVEAASLAWLPLGWKNVFVSEVEPFPCAVLQERFGASAPIHPLDPAEATSDDDRQMRLKWIKENQYLKEKGILPNEGDFTKIGNKYAGKIDLLVGGTPCQDLSVAGKRAGFDGERSSLALDFVRLAYESQCKWFVWENVPGVFSSNEGNDFATLLSLFTGSEVTVPRDRWGSAGFVCNARRDRYGVAWRTLDGQFTRSTGFPFAVPQRRQRVFLVGYFGDWRRAAEVLLEPDRVRWNTPARFKARERFAEIAGANINLAERPLCGAESNRGASNGVDAFNQAVTGDVSKTLNSAASDTDHIPCVIEQNVSGVIQTPNGEDLSDTIDASYYKGVGARNGNERPVICRATQQGNAETMTDACPTITEAAGTSGNNQPIICLNDQGGSVMAVEDNGNAGTLRANTHGNEQIVCGAFVGRQGSKAFGIAYSENYSPAVRAEQEIDLVQTLKIRSGKEGGNNVPLIQCFDARGNGDGSVSPTATGDHLNRITDFTPVIHECYAIDSVHSNSMKSTNPNSGFHYEEIAKTLDTTAPNPTKNQGGNVIVSSVNCQGGQNININNDTTDTLTAATNSSGNNLLGVCEAVAIAENIIGRKVQNGGNGVGAQEELAYTQNATGVMGVCSSTVRRLLPIECERLMGFPDNHTKIPYKGKPAEECPDSPRYKACGNSMCVNVMRWIGEQIDKVEKRYNEK